MTSAPAASDTPKRRGWLLIKFLIAIAVIVALFYFRMIRFDVLLPLVDHFGPVMVAASLIFCTLPLGALRWQKLLSVQGIAMPYVEIYHICAIGAFSGVYLPGAIGGDALRFIYMSAAVPRHRTIIAMTLLADRLLGLAGLAAVAIVVILIEWRTIAQSPFMNSIVLLIIVGVSLVIILAAFVIVVLDRIAIGRWKRNGRSLIFRLLGATIDVATLYRRAPRLLFVSLVISFIIQLCTVSAIVLISHALALSHLIGPVQYALSASISILANAVPITPGGLGVGEGAFQQLCQLLSSDGEAPFASAFFAFRCLTVVVLLVAIPSLIIYRAGR
jgi:glycosyltransferase 2 family protein